MHRLTKYFLRKEEIFGWYDKGYYLCTPFEKMVAKKAKRSLKVWK